TAARCVRRACHPAAVFASSRAGARRSGGSSGGSTTTASVRAATSIPTYVRRSGGRSFAGGAAAAGVGGTRMGRVWSGMVILLGHLRPPRSRLHGDSVVPAAVRALATPARAGLNSVTSSQDRTHTRLSGAHVAPPRWTLPPRVICKHTESTEDAPAWVSSLCSLCPLWLICKM